MNLEDFREIDLETESICASCSEDLQIFDEIHLLEVVMPGPKNGHLEFYSIVDEDGDYEYEPHFFHVHCWEEIILDLEPYIEDRPPILLADFSGVCSCTLCDSDICAWETMGLVHFGELRRSQRSPDGELTTYFDNCGSDPKPVCISCLLTISEEVIELWEGQPLSNDGECQEGTHARCWRAGPCGVGCVSGAH